MFKDKNKNSRKSLNIYSQLTKKHQKEVNDEVLVFLLLTLHIFHTVYYFYCWLSAGKCLLGTHLRPPSPSYGSQLAYLKSKLTGFFMIRTLALIAEKILPLNSQYTKRSRWQVHIQRPQRKHQINLMGKPKVITK